MPYATRQDLIDRYGEDEIAQRESVLPAGSVDRALSDADGEIESYLASRYVVPLSPVPAHVLRVACVIARHHLLGDAVSEAAGNDYKQALAWLRDVQAGRALIAGASAPVSSPTLATISVTNGREKAFTGGIQ